MARRLYMETPSNITDTCPYVNLALQVVGPLRCAEGNGEAPDVPVSPTLLSCQQ